MRIQLTAIASWLAVAGLVSCTPKSGGLDQIVLVNRQNSSGTYKYFQEHVLKKKDFKDSTKDQSGSQSVVDLVGSTPNAVGYSGMGYKTDKVKFLKVSAKNGEPGVLPTVETARNQSYPITRPLQIYTKGEPTGAVAHFMGFMFSEEGQKIVAEEGYVPVDAKPFDKTPPAGEASVQMVGSDTMVQLAQTWAAAYAKIAPNVKVQVSGPGSGVGIAGIIDGTVDIAPASRSMKPDEIAKAKLNGFDPKEFVAAWDALAIYAHKDNPIDTISMEDLEQMYADGGTISSWKQVHGFPQE